MRIMKHYTMDQLTQIFEASAQSKEWTYEESIGILQERMRIAHLIEIVLEKMARTDDPNCWITELLENVVRGEEQV